MSNDQKPRLRLLAKTLEDAIAFIEDLTGEKMTPAEVEQLQKALAPDTRWIVKRRGPCRGSTSGCPRVNTEKCL